MVFMKMISVLCMCLAVVSVVGVLGAEELRVASYNIHHGQGMKSVFRKSIDLGAGGYGNAVLSKYPTLETHLHKLPGPGEARTALEVVCEVKGKKCSVISVHLDHQVETVRVGQVHWLPNLACHASGRG